MQFAAVLLAVCGSVQAQVSLGPADVYASSVMTEPVIVSGDDMAPALSRLMEMQPVSDASLASARQALERAVTQLDAFLTEASEKREAAWRDFLGWQALESQLQKETPSYRPMNLIFQRFDSGYPGLYHSKFRSVWKALRQYNERLKLALAREPRATATKATIASEIAACDELLDADSEAGEAVRDALRWENVSALADNEQIEGTAYRDLMRVAGRLANTSTEPIDAARFRSLSDLLVNFADYKFLTRSQSMRDEYTQRITRIAELLGEFESLQTNDAAGDLLNELAWLDDLGIAPEFTSSLRSRFRRNNLSLDISEHVVVMALSDQRCDSDRTHLCFYGTDVRSCAIANVCTTPALVCCDDCAVIDLHLRGLSVANSVGTQRKVKVYNKTYTHLSARKRLYLTPDGLSADPACTDAPARQELQGVCVDRRCGTKLISRLAARKTSRLKSDAEWAACVIGSFKFARTIDSQTSKRLANSNRDWDQQEADLRERGLYPQALHLSSSCERIYVNALQASDDNLGAWNDPPALTFSSEINSKFHQSSVNNLLRNQLSGRYYDQDSIVQLIEDAGLEVPDELKSGENGGEEAAVEQWSITLAKRQPVAVTFADGNVRVAVRGRKFTREDTELNDMMEIVAVYRPTIVEGKVEANLVGDIDVVFVEQEATLSARQIAYKTFIRRKVGSLFKERFTEEDLPTGDFDEYLDDVSIDHLQIEDNWLCAGVDVDDQALQELSDEQDTEPEPQRNEIFYVTR